MKAANLEWLAPAHGRANGAIVVGSYRYLLWRTWDYAVAPLLWVLLNPSTADGQTDDPTLRRCMGFSRAWGFGGVEIANLFAYRTPYPRHLWHAMDPVGSENDRYLAVAAQRAGTVVVAWGADGTYQQRDCAVLALLEQRAARSLLCLGTTRDGSPRHPLRIARGASLMPYRRHNAVAPCRESC